MMKQASAIEQAAARAATEKTENGQAQPAPAGEADFSGMVDELYGLITSGKLPEGFDLEAACGDAEFASLINEFGAEAAVRIYDAEKRAKQAEANAMERVNTRMQQRKSLPRASSGGAFASAKADYTNMDAASFKKLALEMKRGAQRGQKVSL